MTVYLVTLALTVEANSSASAKRQFTRMLKDGEGESFDRGNLHAKKA